MRKGLLLATAIAAATLGHAATANAFTTRIHIALANEVRTALVAGGGATIALKLGPYSVTLSEADAKAIIEQPLAFRAGAVGPDNVIFPGMTDPSHAIEQRPFEQCQVLYGMALTAEERAYAIGCFLHGSTDAIAHHYVNYMTGETFTLTPLTSARMSSWSNVVRHIAAEAQLQKAAFTLKSGNFGVGPMSHAIPKSFVLRAYFDTKSPLWQMASKHPRDKFEKNRAARPGASLVTLVSTSGLAPAEQLVMAPFYIEEIEAGRKKLRADIEASIKTMQTWTSTDGAKLKVTAGADGVLGTMDDKTACTATCATLYAKYFTYVSILKPRKDAGGMTLPSAFDKISDELGKDLRGFSPALVQTIENVSTKLNGPLSVTSDGMDMSRADVSIAFAPMKDWSDDLTSIDYETISRAIVPDWLQKLEDLMNSVGVSVSIPDIVAALMQPVVQPIKDAIKGYVIDLAEAQVGTLIDEYKKSYATINSEFTSRLNAAATTKGSALANIYDTGIWAHSFNIAAAAIAKHELVLPDADDVGPATFDAAHTPKWMQPGVCEYLRTAIFPLGLDVKALLSVGSGGMIYPAVVNDDAPIECHDGSLTSFTTSPTTTNCKLTSLATLMTSKLGSVSRSYPPDLGTTPPCRYLAVPGLPDPPERPDTGVLEDGGVIPGDGGANPGAANTDADGGCGCHTTASGSNAPWAFFAIASLFALRRRRMVAALVIGTASCSSEPGTVTPGEDAEVTDTNVDEDAELDGELADTRPEVTLPETGSPAAKLLEALGDSVWNGMQSRAGKSRAIEVRFRASTLEWGEIRNPYGPARLRTYRSFTVDADGVGVQSTVLTPSGWPTHPDNGKKETWSFELVPGTPRKLKITQGTRVETFTEGAWLKPTGGLTAFVNVFSATGKVNDAFCGTGVWSSIDRAAIWEFARGKSTEKATGSDVMAGARLNTWNDLTSGDNFAVTDVPGFRDLGGTELTDQANFIVRYFGKIKHPGGTFKMRELDDDVKDAVWAFIGSKAGVSLNVIDLFLEVHGKAAADSTSDEPSTSLSAGDIPIEVLVLRCAAKIQRTDVQVAFGTTFQLVGSAPTLPEITDTIFPPVL
jgi:MYXO-CTERM domain-containing protein